MIPSIRESFNGYQVFVYIIFPSYDPVFGGKLVEVLILLIIGSLNNLLFEGKTIRLLTA